MLVGEMHYMITPSFTEDFVDLYKEKYNESPYDTLKDITKHTELLRFLKESKGNNIVTKPTIYYEFPDDAVHGLHINPDTNVPTFNEYKYVVNRLTKITNPIDNVYPYISDLLSKANNLKDCIKQYFLF